MHIQSIWSFVDQHTLSHSVSMWNNIEIGRGSALDLRAMIHDNELNEFWDGVCSNQYQLQSVERPFNGSGSRNEKINAFSVKTKGIHCISSIDPL